MPTFQILPNKGEIKKNGSLGSTIILTFSIFVIKIFADKIINSNICVAVQCNHGLLHMYTVQCWTSTTDLHCETLHSPLD